MTDCFLQVPVKGGSVAFAVGVSSGVENDTILDLQKALSRVFASNATYAHASGDSELQRRHAALLDDYRVLAHNLDDAKRAHEADKKRWNDINGGLALPVTESERWNAAHSLETARRENKQLRDRQEMYIRDNKDLAERMVAAEVRANAQGKLLDAVELQKVHDGDIKDELRVAREAHKAAAAKAAADLAIAKGAGDALKVSLDDMHRRAQKAESLCMDRLEKACRENKQLRREIASAAAAFVKERDALKQKVALINACDLVKERDALKVSLDTMHRRAQKAEAAACPVDHAGCQREIGRMRKYRDNREHEQRQVCKNYQQQIKDLNDQLRESSGQLSATREGYEGAKARAEKAEQKIALANACGPVPR